MPKIKPLRDYNENDVLPYFAFNGAVPVEAGTVVKLASSGFVIDQASTRLVGALGNSYGNTVSQQYSVNASVNLCASGERPLGVLLYDVRDTDENGEKLIFHPQKARENNWTISGETSLVLTKGVILYSGVPDSVTVGAPAYVSGAGVIVATNTATATVDTKVGKFLGAKSTDGWVMVDINL